MAANVQPGDPDSRRQTRMTASYELETLKSEVNHSVPWLSSRWARFLVLITVGFGVSGWATSPRHSPNCSATSHGELRQIAPQTTNVWTSSGPEGVAINSLAMGAANTHYAGTNDGLFRSEDGGASWNRTGLPGSFVVSLVIDSNNTDIIYAVSSLADGTTVFKSTDRGASWQQANSGLTGDLNALVVDPHDSNTLYVGAYYGGVFKSTDGGENWKQVSLFGVDSLTIEPANSNTLYATGCDEFFGCFLLKSTNGGVDWKDTNNNLIYGPSSIAAIDPRNPDVLYVGSYVEGYGHPHPCVAKSTNGGASWTTSDTGLSEYYVNKVVIDSFNSAIYAGTYGGGIFKSTDGGASWGEFNAGLTNLNIGALATDPSGIDLHAGTSSGVFGYRYQGGCVEALSRTDHSFELLSRTDQSFEFGGGTASVNVIARSECTWAAISNAGWLHVTSDSAGNGDGVVSFDVMAHTTSTRSRITTLLIGGQSITIIQTGVPLLITGAAVERKRLLVFGENFDPGAVILLNGEEQKTKNDGQSPKATLIGKNAGKKIASGESVKLQVRNPNGALSPEFTFNKP